MCSHTGYFNDLTFSTFFYLKSAIIAMAFIMGLLCFISCMGEINRRIEHRHATMDVAVKKIRKRKNRENNRSNRFQTKHKKIQNIFAVGPFFSP